MKKLSLALGILVASAVGLAIAAQPGVPPSPEEHAVAPGSLSKPATGGGLDRRNEDQGRPGPCG